MSHERTALDAETLPDDLPGSLGLFEAVDDTGYPPDILRFAKYLARLEVNVILLDDYRE